MSRPDKPSDPHLLAGQRQDSLERVLAAQKDAQEPPAPPLSELEWQRKRLLEQLDAHVAYEKGPRRTALVQLRPRLWAATSSTDLTRLWEERYKAVPGIGQSQNLAGVLAVLVMVVLVGGWVWFSTSNRASAPAQVARQPIQILADLSGRSSTDPALVALLSEAGRVCPEGAGRALDIAAMMHRDLLEAGARSNGVVETLQSLVSAQRDAGSGRLTCADTGAAIVTLGTR